MADDDVQQRLLGEGYLLLRSDGGKRTIGDLAQEAIHEQLQQGQGYYEVQKKESVSAKKRLVVYDERSRKLHVDAAARSLLGFAKDGKVDSAPGRTVWVQSTSHNRQIPEGSSCLVLLSPEMRKKMGEGAGNKQRKVGKDEEEEEEEDELEVDEEDEDNREDIAKHLKLAKKNVDKLRDLYFEMTRTFRIRPHYVLQILSEKKMETRRDNEKNYIFYHTVEAGPEEWPYAYAMSESQPVLAALFYTGNLGSDRAQLVALWLHSLGGDESSVVLLGSHKDVVYELAEQQEESEDVVDEDCSDYLGVSSGDDIVGRFYCPVLENVPKSAFQE